MDYYTKEEFMKMTGISRSTIDRFYRAYPKLAEERIQKGKRKNMPESHLKYFSWELLFNEEKAKDKKIEDLQKLLTLSRDDESLAASLWKADWNWFGTISYRHDLSKDSCYKKMYEMFNELTKLIGPNSGLKLFFTTEAFDVREGHHSHFVLKCNDSHRSLVKKEVKSMFRKDRIDLRLYNPFQAALFYITKEGLQGEDWDYLF